MHPFNSERSSAATEIEVKVLEINRLEVEKRLSVLGANKVFDGKIHALYYDLPDRRLRTDGLTLRLRMEGAKAVLTLKTDIANAAAKSGKSLRRRSAILKSCGKCLKPWVFLPGLR